MITIHLGHPFLDRVLMRAGESREHQITRVGVPFGHRQLVDRLHGFPDSRHLGEIELWIHALAEHVHGHGDHIAVARAFAVAEQRPFHPLRARHQRKLGGGHAGAPIVVSVQADHDPIPAREIPAEPLDLIRVDVRRRHFHRGRQVDDDG